MVVTGFHLSLRALGMRPGRCKGVGALFCLRPGNNQGLFHPGELEEAEGLFVQGKETSLWRRWGRELAVARTGALPTARQEAR